MKDYTNAVRDILTKHSWKFVRHGKGDHDIWKSPDGKKTAVVDGAIKSRHLANGILSKAGLKERIR
jgi:predicted RNA binding protein YcfA (HicA-like mRNA interferase family)